MKHIIGGIPAPSGQQAKTVLVDGEDAGQRLDNFLMRCLKGVPKTHIYRIIRSGEVRINKGRVHADTRVAAGDLVRLPPVRVAERTTPPAGQAGAWSRGLPSLPAQGFPVLFEDDYFLAIDKPAGVAVHGGSGVAFGVIEQLRMARPGAVFLELVHRLDRETSGVLLVAKRRSALKHLQDQFRQRETGKTYLAVVVGHWPANKKVLDKPLHKYLVPMADGPEGGERRVKVVAKDHPDGMPSLSLVNLRATNVPTAGGLAQAFSLLEVTIKTGRTHQIRVHLASEGMPIAGDDKYGNFDTNKALARAPRPGGLGRMFLHAWRFECQHPASGERMEIRSELPPDLRGFLRVALPGACE